MSPHVATDKVWFQQLYLNATMKQMKFSSLIPELFFISMAYLIALSKLEALGD